MDCRFSRPSSEHRLGAAPDGSACGDLAVPTPGQPQDQRWTAVNRTYWMPVVKTVQPGHKKTSLNVGVR